MLCTTLSMLVQGQTIITPTPGGKTTVKWGDKITVSGGSMDAERIRTTSYLYSSGYDYNFNRCTITGITERGTNDYKLSELLAQLTTSFIPDEIPDVLGTFAEGDTFPDYLILRRNFKVINRTRITDKRINMPLSEMRSDGRAAKYVYSDVEKLPTTAPGVYNAYIYDISLYISWQKDENCPPAFVNPGVEINISNEAAYTIEVKDRTGAEIVSALPLYVVQPGAVTYCQGDAQNETVTFYVDDSQLSSIYPDLDMSKLPLKWSVTTTGAISGTNAETIKGGTSHSFSVLLNTVGKTGVTADYDYSGTLNGKACAVIPSKTAGYSPLYIEKGNYGSNVSEIEVIARPDAVGPAQVENGFVNPAGQRDNPTRLSVPVPVDNLIYRWYTENGTSLGSGPVIEIYPQSSGNYFYRAMNAAGCYSASPLFRVTPYGLPAVRKIHFTPLICPGTKTEITIEQP